MNRLDHKRDKKALRKKRVRSSVVGTADRPRLSVTVSNRHVSAQIIDDTSGNTLATSTTINAKAAKGTLTDLSAFVGADIAQKAKKAKVTKVVFDRNGRSYQKRLAALADAARENGLEL